MVCKGRVTACRVRMKVMVCEGRVTVCRGRMKVMMCGEDEGDGV